MNECALTTQNSIFQIEISSFSQMIFLSFFSKSDIGVIKETFWHDQFIHWKGVAHIIFSHSFQIPYQIQNTRIKKQRKWEKSEKKNFLAVGIGQQQP